MANNTFPLEIMSLRGLIFQDQVESVYLSGTDGEFELLPFHYPLMASLGQGDIKIAKNDSLPIRLGVVMFRDNRCTIIAEMAAGYTKLKKAWF